MKRFVVLAAALVLATAARAEVIHSQKSMYRTIFVYDDGGERCLRFRRAETGSRQTCFEMEHPQRMVLPYARMMMGGLYLNPNPERVLIIGLGGGTLPMAVHSLFPNVQIDVVEIDSAVVQVAKDYFGFAPDERLRAHEVDGRVFVKRAAREPARYDLVMLDAFDDEYIPEHLLTKEFLEEVRGIMTPDGVLAANTFSSSRLYPHESVTYAAVFGDFYNLRANNRVILAKLGGRPSMDVIRKNAAALDERFARFGFQSDWLLPLFSDDRDWDVEARLLTDQYSPSNLLNVR